MAKKIAQIALMLTVYLSIAVAVGCYMTLLTPFFFVTTEMRLEHMPWIRLGRTQGPFLIIIYGRGFPLAWHIEEHSGFWTTKTEFIVNNLLWDMAFHTFVALGVMGMLTIKSKTSKLRAYDLVTP